MKNIIKLYYRIYTVTYTIKLKHNKIFNFDFTQSNKLHIIIII